MNDVATPAHLLSRVRLIEARVHALIEFRRRDDPTPDDPFRGLYLGEDDVDRLINTRRQGPDRDDGDVRQIEQIADQQEQQTGTSSPLRLLQNNFDLDDMDVDLLLAVLLPDLDARYERLYGYLNDDVTRRRATIGLALEIVGARPLSTSARTRLTPGSELFGHRLVSVEDPDRPFLTRSLRVPDRVTSHLLGVDDLEAELVDVLTVIGPVSDPVVQLPADGDEDLIAALARAIGDPAGEPPLVYLRDQGRRSGHRVAREALRVAGRPGLALDLARLAVRPGAEDLIRLVGREARLRHAGVIAEPLEALQEADLRALRRLCELHVPVVVIGDATWDPSWSATVPLQVDAPVLRPDQRERFWLRALDPEGPAVAAPAHLHLGPEQIDRAVRWAGQAARFHDRPVDSGLLQAGARAQNAAGLERLSRRVEPAVTWTDLVLPGTVRGQLGELTDRARFRDQVLTQWRMRPGGGRGIGVTALFAGDSGTGKTMSAEVIAADLGLDLYKVDLATVVDKYVGETEKNLERIFTEAGGVSAVLLFDEADAVFGKRSEVRDAHDRYANIESAYLLQRMETFDGLAILSTNLRANIDEAFTRRLDSIIDFPAPTPDLRLALWEQCLAPPLPLGDDIDLAFCAEAFELTGGNIRSAGITAAYLAAAARQPVRMQQVITAVEQEYRKLGRLVLEREFGRYLSLLR